MPTINLSVLVEYDPDTVDQDLLERLHKHIEETMGHHITNKLLTGNSTAKVKVHNLYVESDLLLESTIVKSEEMGVEIKCPHCGFTGGEGWHLVEKGSQEVPFNPVSEGTSFELSAFTEFYTKGEEETLTCPECGEDSRTPHTFHEYL